MKRSCRKKLSTATEFLQKLESRLLYAAHNDSFDVTYLTQLRSDSAYSSINGKGVAIAVLDTGVDAANPDLSKKVVAYYNAVENAVPSSIGSNSVASAKDNDGHGTHVSGIAASSDPNIGVADGATLVDVKVIADSGETQLAGDPLLRGLEFVANFASQLNIKVVNMSLGESTSSGGINDNTVPAADDISREIQTLEAQGITVVAAAGNSYANNPTAGESYPAVVSTISVANVWSDTGSGYDFSTYSYGTSSDSWAAVESSAAPDQLAATSQRSTLSNQVVAPGMNIYSDWNGTSAGDSGSDLFHNTISGTSMASPFIAGVVALIQQAAYTYGGQFITSPQEVLSIIKQTSTVIVDTTVSGDGRVPISNGSLTGGAEQPLPGTGNSYDLVNVYKAIQDVKSLFTGTISNADTNNTSATATSVPNLNGTISYTESGNIGTDGLNNVGANDVDVYKVILDETGSLTAALSQPGGGTAFQASLRIFNSSGGQIAVASGTSSAGYPTITTATGSPLAVGTYFVAVSSAGNIAYNITDGTGASGGSTTGDYSLALSLGNPDPNGVPAGAVQVDLTAPTFENNNGVVSNYYLGTLGKDPASANSGTYVAVPNGDVDMFKIVAPDTGTLTAQTVTSDPTNFSYPGADTYVEVFDSTLNLVAHAGVASNAPSNAQIQFNVTVGDVYYVAVTVASNANFSPTDPYTRVVHSTASPSSYDLYLTFNNGNADGTALLANSETIGTAVSGNIASTNPLLGENGGSKYVDWYTYTTATAGLLDLTAMGASSAFSPSLELWTLSTNSAGSTVIVEVGGTTGSGNSLIDAVTAGETVYVSLTGAGNNGFEWFSLGGGSGGETGGYTLNSSLLSASATATQALNDNSIDYGKPGSVTLGQAIAGNIGMDGGLIQGPSDVDLYTITPTASGAYDIATDTSQEGSADTYLRLFDSSGNQLATNDNANASTTASLIRANLVAGQTYYVGVSGTGNDQYNAITAAGAVDSASTGAYVLKITSATLPALTVSSPATVSASVGGNSVVFNVTLDFPATSLVTVDYSTADGTAVAGTDYTATSGQLIFQPGDTSQTVSVPILVNPSAAGTTTFSLDLYSPSSNVVIDGGQGTGTISNLPVTQLPFGNGRRAIYLDSFGRNVTFLLSGPGSGVVSDIGSGTAIEATVTGTTSKSRLTVLSSAREATGLSSLQVNGSLGLLNAPHVELEGSLNVTGTLGTLVIAGASASSTISIGGAGASGTFQLGNVTDLSVTSSETLNALLATNWTNLDNTDSITAPFIKLVRIAGPFGALIHAGAGASALQNVRVGGAITGGTWTIDGNIGTVVAGSTALAWNANVSGSVTTLQVGADSNGSISAGSIRTLRVGGNVSSASWNLTNVGTPASPDLSILSVGGIFSNSELRSAGDMNALHFGGISGSIVDAGVRAGVTGLAGSAADFSATAEIVSFAVTGVRGSTFAMANSTISAAELGKVLVERVETDNNAIPFGFATSSLAAFTDLEAGKKPYHWTPRSSTAAPVVTGDFQVKLL